MNKLIKNLNNSIFTLQEAIKKTKDKDLKKALQGRLDKKLNEKYIFRQV